MLAPRPSANQFNLQPELLLNTKYKSSGKKMYLKVYLNTSAPLTSHPQIYQEITRNLNSSCYNREEKRQSKK